MLKTLSASWKNENGAGQSKRLFYILCNPVLKRGSASLKEYFFCNSVAAGNHNNNNRSSRVLSMRSVKSIVSQEGGKKRNKHKYTIFPSAGSARSADSKSV